MSLNNITVTPSLLASLYKKTLIGVEATEENLIGSNVADAEIKYLGNNAKNILIVVDYKSSVHIPEPALGFLSSVLTACNLDLGDIALLNKHNNTAAEPENILKMLNSEVVILFGIAPSEFGSPVNFPAYQVQLVNKKTFLHAPALDDIEKDKNAKKKLWTGLKKIFSV